MNSLMQKTWISPFVAVSFFVLSITGILMLLHAESHYIANLHEWIGVFFVISGVLHLILNWSAFLSCFRNKQSVLTIIFALALSLILLIGGMFGDKERHDFPGRGDHYRGYHR